MSEDKTPTLTEAINAIFRIREHRMLVEHAAYAERAGDEHYAASPLLKDADTVLSYLTELRRVAMSVDATEGVIVSPSFQWTPNWDIGG